MIRRTSSMSNTVTPLARMLVAVETGSHPMNIPFSREMWRLYDLRKIRNENTMAPPGQSTDSLGY